MAPSEHSSKGWIVEKLSRSCNRCRHVEGGEKAAFIHLDREVRTMITRDMIIADIIRQHPETLPVFQRYNLECYECQIADLETIEHGAVVHKVDVEQLLSALNNTLVPSGSGSREH